MLNSANSNDTKSVREYIQSVKNTLSIGDRLIDVDRINDANEEGRGRTRYIWVGPGVSNKEQNDRYNTLIGLTDKIIYRLVRSWSWSIL